MFEWDAGNCGHVQRHGVTPVDAEEALGDPDRIVSEAYNTTERRYAAVGATGSGRLLLVIWTQRNGKFRIITALDASSAQIRQYRKRRP